MMKLILSLTLIWMLSSTDGALQCYNSINRTLNCQPNQHCVVMARRYDRTYTTKGCYSHCALGSETYSYNFGFIGQQTVNLRCCNTSLCNNQDVPYPDVPKENGLQCFTCEHEKSNVCNKTVQCAGIEDRCISGIGLGDIDESMKFAGCVSSNVCEPVNVMGIHFANGTNCCEGSFCNSAWSVKLNVVLLLLGLSLFTVC